MYSLKGRSLSNMYPFHKKQLLWYYTLSKYILIFYFMKSKPICPSFRIFRNLSKLHICCLNSLHPSSNITKRLMNFLTFPRTHLFIISSVHLVFYLRIPWLIRSVYCNLTKFPCPAWRLPWFLRTHWILSSLWHSRTFLSKPRSLTCTSSILCPTAWTAMVYSNIYQGCLVIPITPLFTSTLNICTHSLAK